MSFGIQSVTSSSFLPLLSAPNNATTGAQPTDPFANPNGLFANLNLTTDQQNQVSGILAAAKNQGLSVSAVTSQIDQVLTPAQQQTFQSDLQQVQSHKGGHHHHHHGGSSAAGESSNLLGQLDLTGDQQNQIASILQNAQANGSSPSDVLSQIDNVLTESQQTQLANLLSTGAYSSSGDTTTNTLPYLINTNA